MITEVTVPPGRHGNEVRRTMQCSVVGDQGKEEIITGEIPYSSELFRVFQENGWLNLRRSVSSIRETRAQRRVMSA